MIPRKGDLSDVKTWRPIALLTITPKCCVHVCDRFWTAINQQINLAVTMFLAVLNIPHNTLCQEGEMPRHVLFNTALKLAFHSPKSRLGNAGIYLGQQQRQTNVRYADDLMLYSTSSCEITYLLEPLICHLKKNRYAAEPSEHACAFACCCTS